MTKIRIAHNRQMAAAVLTAVLLLPGLYMAGGIRGVGGIEDAGRSADTPALWNRDAANAVVRISGAAAETVQAFRQGPGNTGGMPYSDTYIEYQWALRNTGEFKLVPSSRVSVENMFQGWIGGQKPGQNQGTGPAQESEGSTLSVSGVDVNVVPAWEKYDAREGKRQVVVALIDTGVDYGHPDLVNSVWVNADEIPGDGIDNDGNGYVDDVYGWNFYSDNNQVFVGTEDNHGTHSAGTIAAAHDGVGTVGICDPAYVKIMIIKTLGTASGVGTADNVARAIRYAEANGAVICNLSFGTSKYSEELYRTMKNSGMLFVVAAGNGDMAGRGYNIDDQPVYPASFGLDNIISVANLQFDGQLDPSSNYGAKNVDLAAPGSYILSTVSGGRYSYMSGTSMAAPMVTGAAAMLYSYDPAIAVTEIKGRLLNSARRLTRLDGKVASGGMLDVAAALRFSE